MLPSLAPTFIAGLLLGSQIPHFPLSTSLGLLVIAIAGVTLERFDMGRGVVGPYLWNRGIRTIDHLIGTHPQLDHLGGLTWLIRHIPVRRYWGSREQRDEFFYHRFLDAVDEKGLVEQIPMRGKRLCRVVRANGSC